MKKISPLIFILFFAAILRISWKLYTHFTYEDAFITFRFARNLSNGLGFVYNANEHIYGTTTPLFTLLMAGWIKLFPDYVVFGATLFGLLAGLVSIALVWKLLEALQIAASQRILVTGVLVLSDRLWTHDMGGMETSLVICMMIASYLILIRNKPVWAGAFAGILLWLRIDGLFWVCFLALSAWLLTRQFPTKFILTTVMVYLPWCVFATLYFGSPIPYTIYAKWVAYYTAGLEPVLVRVGALLRGTTPVTLPNLTRYAVNWLAILTVLLSIIGTIAYRQHKWLMVLPAFCLAEIVRLVAMGETFESRYFMPFFWALMLLFGLGVHTAWMFLSDWLKPKPFIVTSTIVVIICVSVWFSWQRLLLFKQTQSVVYDSSLKQLGIWLDKNSPKSSTVLLEPLGYVGFYANRHMIDDVGLVSPQVVAYKVKGLTTSAYVISLEPDYVILHCDDSLRASEAFLAHYSQAVEFNPMDFDPQIPINYDINNMSPLVIQDLTIPRSACYQIWKK